MKEQETEVRHKRKSGVMEYWRAGVLKKHLANQYSNTLVFQSFLLDVRRSFPVF